MHNSESEYCKIIFLYYILPKYLYIGQHNLILTKIKNIHGFNFGVSKVRFDGMEFNSQ